MTAATVLIDGNDVDKSALRDLLTGYETLLATLQTSSGSNGTAITALQAAIASLQSLVSGHTTSIAALQTSFTAFQQQGIHGMGPMAPVIYPGLALEGAVFNNDSPFGTASLAGGVGVPCISPIQALPFTLEIRAKDNVVSGAVQVAMGQAGQAWLGAAADGTATAHFSAGPNQTAPGAPPTSDVTLSTSVNICDNNYHALALVVTASGSKFFVDGTLAASSATVANIFVGPSFAIRDLGGQLGSPWQGEVCEAVVWPTARYTSNYTVPPSGYAGTEGMTALYHLNGNGLDAKATAALAIGSRPANASGIRFFLKPGDSVTYTVQPTSMSLSAPSGYRFTVSYEETGPNWDEPFTDDLMLFVTGAAGSPLFRWI